LRLPQAAIRGREWSQGLLSIGPDADESHGDAERFSFRIDAFNVFNHTIFTGVNSGLNFTAYPANSSGVITGLPGYSSTALAINNPAQGCRGPGRRWDWTPYRRLFCGAGLGVRCRASAPQHAASPGG
jgi:hypothetical protein